MNFGYAKWALNNKRFKYREIDNASVEIIQIHAATIFAL